MQGITCNICSRSCHIAWLCKMLYNTVDILLNKIHTKYLYMTCYIHMLYTMNYFTMIIFMSQTTCLLNVIYHFVYSMFYVILWRYVFDTNVCYMSHPNLPDAQCKVASANIQAQAHCLAGWLTKAPKNSIIIHILSIWTQMHVQKEDGPFSGLSHKWSLS